jgi:iron complex outermembrane receptor protein
MIAPKITPKLLPLLIAAFPLAAWAGDVIAPIQVEVLGRRPINTDDGAAGTSDTTLALVNQPGYSVYAAGGVSALPALRGLADDRIKILIDGAETTAACGNHMNSPLSYISPSQVGGARVMPGLSPVSQGGDNIAGVIAIDSPAPVFATGDSVVTNGTISLQSRSVDHGVAAGLSTGIASNWLSIIYSGATTRADSYKDGNGDKVLDTLYKATNQSVTLAAKADAGLWTLKAGQQDIPYQGFPNEYMDMTHNRSSFANLDYQGAFGWGKLDARVYWQEVNHDMGFFSDERAGTMPMNTEGQDDGYRVQIELPLGQGVARVGQELHRTHLDDWWPGVADSMMMGPNPYVNIHDGHRNRTALYGEWEGKLADKWGGIFGIREESVRMDTGTVQDYGCGMMCGADDAAAKSFNAANRSRHDNNLDLSLVAHREVDSTLSYEFGVAQKTRSPSLYERYSWGRGTMAMTMIGWFGDGNGYVGNLDLKPEVARTLSATVDWHANDGHAWRLTATPFYTKVKDFIDVDSVGTFSPSGGMDMGGRMNMGGGMNMGPTRALLQFANHDATLYGVNVAGAAQLWSSAGWGTGTIKGKIDWTRGKRDDGGDLYHIMPLNALLTLVQTQGAWSGEVQLEAVARKSRVDQRRDELATAGYGLANLVGKYQFAKAIEATLGVRNLFNRQYALPLGGVDLAQGSGFAPLVGQGRSIDAGVSVKF